MGKQTNLMYFKDLSVSFGTFNEKFKIQDTNLMSLPRDNNGKYILWSSVLSFHWSIHDNTVFYCQFHSGYQTFTRVNWFPRNIWTHVVYYYVMFLFFLRTCT